MQRLSVAVLGAGGLVAQRLQQRLANHPWFELGAVAGSPRYLGVDLDKVPWILQDERPSLPSLKVVDASSRSTVEALAKAGVSVAFSALPSEEARHLEPMWVEAGIKVFSNASTFRRHEGVPFVIPEINPVALTEQSGGQLRHACATNCTLLPLILPLAALHETYGLTGYTMRSEQGLSGGGHAYMEAAIAKGRVESTIPGEAEKTEAELRHLLGWNGEANLACQRVMRSDGHHVFVEAVSGSPSFESHGHDTFCFGYPSSATTVEVRMCSSFISQEQARHTYDVELRRESSHERSFGDVRLESEDEWNALLSRAAVKNTHADVSPPTSALEGKDLVVFYTGLYRALTFPRRIDEPSARGAEKRLHWSPYSKGGSVHDGTLVTDNGFWDTFRTVYPLLALVYPDHLGWIVDGWVNAYREGGWIPKWASPGYRNSMVGTYGDVVVAEAIVKGVGGFDEAAAWDALHKDAYEEAPQGGAVGKVGLRVYNQHGYIPADSGVSDCVSRTLDFAHADWATANAAEVLGHAEDAKRLRDRARGCLLYTSPSPRD